MDLVYRLGFMLSLLAAGVAARELGVLREAGRDRLNAVAFYVALPALVFTSTHDRALGELLSPELVVGLWLVMFAVFAIGWTVHRRADPPAVRSVAVVQSYHCNFGYLGLPLVAATLGAAAAAKASVVLGAGVLVQTPLTILVLLSMNDADASFRGELRSVATNPILIALALGLVVAASSLTAPAPVATGLGWISDLALPIALVLVGSSLDVELPDSGLRTLGAVVGLKVVLMPALGWVAFSATGAEPLARNAGVVMVGAPTAVSTFIYATELGGDADFASVTVFTSTVVSVATLGVVLQLVT